MENFTSLDALKGGWHLFRSSWKPMAAYALLVWVATLCVLSPLVSWTINRLVAQSGELVVGNSEIYNRLLSPKGILTFVLWGALTLLGILLQVTGLIRIAFEGKKIENWTVRQALHWLQADSYPLFRFCLSAFLLCVLILLPLIVCFVAIYLILLGAHDINYYLSVKPTEWKWALVFCALSFLLWGSAVCILFWRWIYAFPLWLEGMRPFCATLAFSWDATYRKFFLLLRTMGAYLAISIGAMIILEAFLFMTAGIALRFLNQPVQAIFRRFYPSIPDTFAGWCLY